MTASLRGRFPAIVFAWATLTLPAISALAEEARQHTGDSQQQTQQTRTQEPEYPPLLPLKASYSASMDKGISLSGSATRSLAEREDGTWIYRTDVDSFIADIEESLVLRWENNQVVPLRYRYKLSGFLIRDREEAIDFDWDNRVATGHHEGDSFSVALEDGALDPMGYQLQLHQDIRAGKREMVYRVIDEGDFDTDRFAVIDEETLQTDRGKITTVKAEKVRDADSKRQTLMWFAPDQEYLLVRLLQVEPDGSRYEITIDEAEIRR
ncbi:DUF3108 domain-containing protein [Marinobacter sp. NP-4(2019)]|uniref:DUF3108 domain-containing protein n=1 Tax=Marinobacter sp. NP-4(2019) TaxID=2488665 RepID=UPI000FC3CE69|nr:DUF3108 domain-containing protein [Marinobacter sp. NP-4(2019)]AZT83516.1 DUF3108 domain-containing protein [Marinobacter sp. NP-4(2019)]AZT83522.1 DUF3108 domain-containing protein [Marinobacter sp. NP-4(2019)]